MRASMDVYKMTGDDGTVLHDNVHAIKINAGSILHTSKGMVKK
jgi:hypothetical protein